MVPNYGLASNSDIHFGLAVSSAKEESRQIHRFKTVICIGRSVRVGGLGWGDLGGGSRTRQVRPTAGATYGREGLGFVVVAEAD